VASARGCTENRSHSPRWSSSRPNAVNRKAARCVKPERQRKGPSCQRRSTRHPKALFRQLRHPGRDRWAASPRVVAMVPCLLNRELDSQQNRREAGTSVRNPRWRLITAWVPQAQCSMSNKDKGEQKGPEGRTEPQELSQIQTLLQDPSQVAPPDPNFGRRLAEILMRALRGEPKKGSD
jgi:hypothetical protein